MQIILNFTFDVLNLPIAYNSMVQGFIYNALGRQNPEYSDYIHNKKSNTNADESKPFVFGRIKGINGLYHVDRKRNNIIYRQRATLEIRSYDETFFKNFISAINKGEEVRIGRNLITLEDVICKNVAVTQSTVHCITETPLCFKAEHSEDRIFCPEAAREKLIKNAVEKWCSAGYDTDELMPDISFGDFVPVRRQCKFKEINITGWETDFYLTGTPSVLDFLYNAGIGARNSQGFGMFNIIE